MNKKNIFGALALATVAAFAMTSWRQVEVSG